MNFVNSPRAVRPIIGCSSIAGIVCAVLFALAPSAWGDFTTIGEFSGPGAGDGELNRPKQSAVEQSTGNLFVVDSENDRVQVFAPDGDAAGYLTQLGAGELDNPYGIAIHEDAGQTVVYVSSAGGQEIVKFASDEQATPTFTVDGTFASPAQGADPDQVANFAAALDVAPNGDLWVADIGNHQIKRYTPTGAHVGGSNIDGSSSGTAFTAPVDIAVDSTGDLVVLDISSDGDGDTDVDADDVWYDYGATARVERFDSTGAHDGTVGPFGGAGDAAFSVAVDRDDDHVFMAGYISYGLGAKLRGFLPDGNPTVDLSLSDALFAGQLPGLAPASGSGRVYVTTDVGPGIFTFFGKTSVQVIDDVPAPDPVVQPATHVTADSATLHGTVDPNGNATNWHFQYSTDGNTWTKAPDPDHTASGDDPVAVQATISGLEPSIEYRVKLVARKGSLASVESAETTFETSGVPPVAVTGMVANVTATTARLTAFIDPRNDVTTYRIEYGPEDCAANPCTSVPASPGDAGSGGQPAPIGENVTGLTPNTTYHYRVTATNATDTVEGEDRTFTTHASDPAPRGPNAGADGDRRYELVNPPDKNAYPVGGPEAMTDDGQRILWSRNGGGEGESSGALTNQLVATRTEGGWASRPAMPRPEDRLMASHQVKAVSRDLTRFIVTSYHGAAFSPPPGPRHLLALDENRNTTLLHQWDGTSGVQYTATLSGTDDLSRAYGWWEYDIAPDDTNGTYDVYEFASGEPKLVSRLPDGSVAPCGASQRSYHSDEATTEAMHWTSRDGLRVFFVTAGDAPGCPESADALYVATDEGTERISPPPVSGPDAGVRFIGATPDGEVVHYRTAATLLPGDTDPGFDVYRHTLSTGTTECVTCELANGALVSESASAYASEDGRSLFFRSFRKLAPEAVEGEPSVYALHDGVLDYVGPDPAEHFALVATSGGEVVFFTSPATGLNALTGTDNGGLLQLYRYDAANREIACVSCPSGRAATRPVKRSGFQANEGQSLSAYRAVYPVRSVTETGDRAFFVTEEALAAADVNGDEDVYEWHAGRVGLVTDGTSLNRGPMGAAMVTPDGRSAAFFAANRLTDDVEEGGQPSKQLYVARIGGGFESAPADPGCEGDGCQAPPPSGRGARIPGSSTFAGPGDQAGRADRLVASVARPRLIRGTTGVVRVTVPRRGRIAVAGRGIRRKAVTVRRAGTYRVTVRLTARAGRTLSRDGRLSLRAVIRYLPAGGRPSRVRPRLTFTSAKPGVRRATVQSLPRKAR
jgi:hypothetical protein